MLTSRIQNKLNKHYDGNDDACKQKAQKMFVQLLNYPAKMLHD